jgi:hypothetical protein
MTQPFKTHVITKTLSTQGDVFEWWLSLWQSVQILIYDQSLPTSRPSQISAWHIVRRLSCTVRNEPDGGHVDRNVVLHEQTTRCVNSDMGKYRRTGTLRAGPRHVGAPGRLIIWRPFKPIFFKNLFNFYLAGARRHWFSIGIYFLPVMYVSRVVTWVNWHHISDLFQWYFSAPYRLAPRAAARLAHPLTRPWIHFKHIGMLQYRICDKDRAYVIW